MSLAIPTIERFEPKYMLVQDSGCWIWTAALNAGGYGLIGHNKRSYLAHRFAYEHFIGPIPKGLQIDHLCRTRCCVNPDHLEPVTPKVNTRRGAKANKTHCRLGHVLDGRKSNGTRFCKECDRVGASLYRARVRDGLQPPPPCNYIRRKICVNGHKMTEENTYVSKKTDRHRCRECQRIANAKYQKKRTSKEKPCQQHPI